MNDQQQNQQVNTEQIPELTQNIPHIEQHSAIQTPQEVPPHAPPPPSVPNGVVNKTPKPIRFETFIPLLLAVLAIITGIVLFWFIQQIQQSTKKPDPITIVVTPTPSPTPIRTATDVSKLGAFTAFVENTASLSAKINEFKRDDPALSPPSLVLPLGF